MICHDTHALMSRPKEKFATQVDPELLSKVRSMAADEGRQLQAVVEEAFRDLIDKRHQAKPRRHIMAYYESSLEKFEPLYKKLAK